VKNILFIPILISSIFSLIFLQKWIKKCKDIGLVWEDMNKPENSKKVAASGGIVVILAFTLGVLSYIAIRTFLLNENNGIAIEIFGLLSSILILAIIGFVDDLLGWRKGGLSKRFRIFLILFSSIPLIVINAGDKVMNFPFLGTINFGFIYPLFLIPLGIVGATTTYNFLAGFNGLEAGQGIIILSFLSFVAYKTGSSWLSLIGMIMVLSLIIFYIFNRYPAQIFPGDVLTYPVGALIAIMAILGNFERIALFIFIPYIIETILKLRGELKKQSFGRPQKDNSLEMPYDRIYSLNHLAIFTLRKFKKKVYEKDVVYFIFGFQITMCLLALWLFRGGLFS